MNYRDGLKTHYYNLTRYLKEGYDAYVRPVIDPKNITTVEIDLTLFQIVDLVNWQDLKSNNFILSLLTKEKLIYTKNDQRETS